MKLRSDLHLARKAYHFLGMAVVIFLYNYLSRPQSLKLCGAVLVFGILLEIIRHRNAEVNRQLIRIFGAFIRRQEIKGLTGMTYLFIGLFTVILVFPKNITNLSLILLAVGDPISSIFGVLYGKDKIWGNKSLQGSFAGFIACSLAGIIYFSIMGIFLDRIILVGVITGLIGALAETLPLGKLDDNFTLPVISATLLYPIFYFFEGF